MAHLVEVAFKGNRKEFFLWDYPDPPPLNAAVIVDVDRGEDLGYIHALGDLAQKRNGGCFLTFFKSFHGSHSNRPLGPVHIESRRLPDVTVGS